MISFRIYKLFNFIYISEPETDTPGKVICFSVKTVICLDNANLKTGYIFTFHGQ